MESSVEQDDGLSVGLGCALEAFREYDEIKTIINDLKENYQCSKRLEILYERYRYLLDLYQEQPHLLDSHLDFIIKYFLDIIRNKDCQVDLKHQCFKFMYILTKVRGFKVVIRHLPHEVSDIEPVLQMISEQNPCDISVWHTRYMLLLWLSILSMVPFHLSRLDSGDVAYKSVTERILEIIKMYLKVGDKAIDGVAFLSAHFVSRPDIKETHLKVFLDWILQELSSLKLNSMTEHHIHAGMLSALARLFKVGKREDISKYGSIVLKLVSQENTLKSENILVRKMTIKLIQRIGLSFLASKLQPWRYLKSSKQLMESLNGKGLTQPAFPDMVHENNMEIPEIMEDVIDQLFQGLGDRDTVVRWSAAKGIGRVTSRLPKEFASEVVSTTFDVFSKPSEDALWHGGCLSLAEFGRRGVLLPEHLPKVISVIQSALVYDELRGTCLSGANVRDAACYLCWTLGRSYDPADLSPFVNSLASALITCICYDREVNCRRAASAAFQENVGRQGTFPRGIDIITLADYFSLGLRAKSYIVVSVEIASFPEYAQVLISHLLEKKVGHWDANIRELTAHTLNKLTFKDPEFMLQVVLPKLVTLASDVDLNSKHGAVLALGDIVQALSPWVQQERKVLLDVLGKDLIGSISSLIYKFLDAKIFSSVFGEKMKIAFCYFIHKISSSHFPVHNSWDILDKWQGLIEDCLQDANQKVRSQAVPALSAVCAEYYQEYGKRSSCLISKCVENLQSGLVHVRCGYSEALGCLPEFMLVPNISTVLRGLLRCAHVDEAQWAESRREAILSIVKICQTVVHRECIRPSDIDEIYACLLLALEDYSKDSRGDIGVVVREAAMTALKDLSILLMSFDPTLLSEKKVSAVMCSILQQCVERIDRTRSIGGLTFSQLLHSTPQIPHIPHFEEAQAILPKSVCDTMIWSSPTQTFPYWNQFLSLPTYTKSLLTGFIVSIGGLTESLVVHSQSALLNYLHMVQEDDIEMGRICDSLIKIFEDPSFQARAMIPFLCALERILNSGVLYIVPSSFLSRLLDISWQKTARSKSAVKILAVVDLYCSILQYDEDCQKKALNRLMVLLCHRFPRIRTAVATKLYEAFLLYSGIIDETKFDEVCALLSDTDWTSEVESLQAVRTLLCQLLHLTPPAKKK